MIKGRYTDFDDGVPVFSVGTGVGDELTVAVAPGSAVAVAVGVIVGVAVGVAVGMVCHTPPLNA